MSVQAQLKSTIRYLADEIIRAAAAEIQNKSHYKVVWGVVDEIDAGPPASLKIKIDGDASPTAGIRFLDTYYPVVGDTVRCEWYGRDLVAIGALADSLSTQSPWVGADFVYSYLTGGPTWLQSVTVSGFNKYLILACGSAENYPGGGSAGTIQMLYYLSHDDATIGNLIGTQQPTGPGVGGSVNDDQPFALTHVWAAPDTSSYEIGCSATVVAKAGDSVNVYNSLVVIGLPG